MSTPTAASGVSSGTNDSPATGRGARCRGGRRAYERVGPEVGTNAVGRAVLLDHPSGPRGRRGDRGAPGRWRRPRRRGPSGLVRRPEPQRNGLGEQTAKPDDLLAGVLHAGENYDAERPPLRQDLRKQPGGLPPGVGVGVGGQDRELVDREHMQGVRPGRAVQSGVPAIRRPRSSTTPRSRVRTATASVGWWRRR